MAVRAFDRAGDPNWYREQLDGTGLMPWSPAKLYEQAMAASLRKRMAERMRELGMRSWWDPPEDATPEQIAEMEEFAKKMLTPDEAITTRIDIAGAPFEAKFAALKEHVTQIGPENPFLAVGPEVWREFGSQETSSCASPGSSPPCPRPTCSRGSHSPPLDDVELPGQESLRGLVDLAHHHAA